MANGIENFGFEDLFPAGVPAAPTGGFKPLFDPVAKAEQVAVASEAKKQSLIDKLGYEQDSPIGQGLNLGASLVSGASRLAGNLATLPIDATASLASATTPEDVFQAYNRNERGEASASDLDLLNSVAPGEDTGAPQTFQQRLDGLKGLQETGKAVADFFDLSGIVDTTRRDRLSRELRESTAEGVADIRGAKEAYDQGNLLEALQKGASGVASTIGNAVATGVQAPGAIAEYTVENLPQLAAYALNPVLGASSNVGYGFDAYRQGATDYLENNNGQFPDQGERLEMGLYAASAALAEQVGDASLLRGFAGAGRGGLAGAAASTAGAAAKEGITEGYQTFAEAKAALKQPSLEEIVEGATIGALVGANFHGATELASAGRNAEQATLDSQEQAASVEEAFTAAVASGDVSALADPQLPTYDPVRAVDALNQVSVGADEATVVANLQQADQIQQDLTKQVSQVERALAAVSPEAKQEALELREAMVAAGAPQADMAQIDAEIAAQNSVTPEQVKAQETRLAGLQAQLTKVQQASERMRIDTSPEQAEVAVIAENAQAGDMQAVDRLITLTMTNPDSVSPEVADALAQNEALPVAQRTALARFSEAQVAANALKGRAGVRSDIATGGDGFKGISQYRSAIRMALANGNIEAARSQVDGIASFAASRVSKFEAIAAAYEQVKGTDNSINIVRDEQNVWGPTTLEGKALREAGGLVIDRKSFRLRDDVSLEADVLNKTAAAYSALVDAAPAPAAAPVVQPEVAEQVQATEQPENVQTPEVTQEAASAEAVPTGELSVVRDRTGVPVTAENYTQVNLVGELFTQNAGSDTDASVRPLVAHQDFMSKVRAGEVSYSDVLAQQGPITMPQQAALASFTEFARSSEQAIRAAFKVTETRAKRPDFFYRDMAQFLQGANGQIDENLATAVSYGLYSWVNENATQLRNSPEAINAILLRDLDADVSNVEYAALSRLGTRQAVVASQLGGRIIQALGLQLSNQGTQAELSKLEASIGARAIAAAANMGLLERVQFSDVALQALMKSGETGNPRVKHTFVRIAAQEVDGKLTANAQVAGIRTANTGSQSVVAKVFGVEAAGVEPSYQPVPFDQKFAKRTKQDVPQVLAETLEKEGARAHKLRQNMWHVWGKLSKQALYTIGGAVETADTPTHVENLEGRNAKSDGIRAQVDNFDSFINTMASDVTTEGLEQSLYFGRSVWKPQRVGLTANVINPQTSKVHRHMLAMEGWGAQVTFADPAMMANFKLRVLEAFGVKTEADITSNVLAGFDAKVSAPAIAAGVDALVDLLRDAPVATNEAAILAAVAAAGENFHSFDALVALAEMKIAQQDGKPGFETAMMGEVDGLTNGPMLSLAMLGAKGWETMIQGGFFPLGSQYNQFNEYKAEGGLDLYESNIAAAVQRLQGSDRVKLDALQVITGQLATDEGKVTKKGRNVIKKPLTALMFGSNTTTAVQGMGDAFIETIYTRMEGAAASRSQEEMNQIIDALNVLILNKQDKLRTGMGYDVALNTKLTDNQKLAIKGSFYELLGAPTEEALGDTYATFIARRNTINQTAQMAFHVYNAVRDGVTEAVIAKSPEVARNRSGEALRTLTKEQQSEIDRILGDMAPILQTAMSQQSGQREAGMYMAKSERALDSSKPFESEVAFGEMAQTIDTDGKMMGIGSTQVNAFSRRDIDPGVMPFITSIHSMDSSIASTVYGSMEALNVHDALGVDLNNMEKVGQELNKATFNNLMNYSSATSMSNMLDEVLAGAARIMQDEKMADLIQPKLKAVADQRKKRKMGSFADQVTAIRTTATQADTDKLNLLAEMKAVGQYATEGGSYTVTAEDRAAAMKKLGEVGSTFNAAAESIAVELDNLTNLDSAEPAFGQQRALSAASLRTLAPATSLNSLQAVMNRSTGNLAAAVQETMVAMEQNNIPLASALEAQPEVVAADIVAAVAAQNKGKLSVWGQLGEPVVRSNVDMVQLMESTPDMTGTQLAQALEAYVQDPFQKTLLKMVQRGLPAATRVQYITSATGPDGAYGEGVSKARGWFAQRAGKATIFVKSPEFVESGLTPEMLTHELVHATLANLVDQHTGKQSAVGRAVAELEQIRHTAANYIAQNGALSAKYRNATSDVQELLAWGLTNQDFQKEVLGAINFQTRDTGLLSGLKAFIQKITAMLFNGSVREESALAAFVAQSAGLFREAAANRETKDASTLRYEDAMDDTLKLTAVQVFDSIADLPGNKTTPEHSLYLRDLLEATVQPIYGPYDVNKEKSKRYAALTPLDAMLKAVETGTAPFSTAATKTAFITTQEEAFVVESVEAVVQHAMSNPNTLFVRQALQDLFEKAQASLKPLNFHNGDWATASVNEKKVATEKFNFLLRPSQAGGKSAHLARFAALGLASNEVRNVLTFGSTRAETPLKNLPWGQRLTELYRRVMTRLAALHTKVQPGSTAAQGLETLTQQLVDIEAKRKAQIAERKLISVESVDAAIGNAANSLREKVDAFGQSDFLRKSRVPGFKLAGVALSTVAGDRLEAVLDTVTKIRDQEQKSRHGLVMGLLTEWRGTYDSRRMAAELFKGAKANEQARKNVIENTAANVNASFANAGQDMTQAQRDAVTKFFLRTNAQAIEAAVGMDRLKVMINDNREMQAYRAQLERDVQALSAEANYMISQTKDLAHHRVVGGSTSANLMQSTRNIAAMYGTKKALKDVAGTEPLVKLLDQLMAVYAMTYSDTEVRREAEQVLRTESNRTDGNGVEFVLKLHRGLQEKSTKDLFQGTEALQMTGYTPEIHDNKIEVLLVSRKDVAAHIRAGYQLGSNLQQDPNWTSGQQNVLMTRRGAGQTALLTGAVSFTGMNSRGTSPVTEALNMMQGTQTTSAQVRTQIQQAKAADIAALFNRGLSYDPRHAKFGHMAPTLAPDGKIADYRHMMTEHNRDVLLDRDSSMDQVLGVMAGQIVDKVSSAQQNADVVGALYDQYRADFNNRPSSYLTVGPDVADKTLAEAYRLFPESMKQNIRKVWKSDYMRIPADQIDMILGYRKFSLTNAFQALPTERNVFEKTLVAATGAIFGEKAELRVGQAEDMIQALVAEMKDILVVKNVITLAGNIMSNMTLLAWEGVPIKTMISSQAVAIKGAMDYRKDARRLEQLEQMVDIGYTAQTAAVEQEMLVLRDRLARNPVKPLVDAGLLPTIVEDVSVNDDRYSYKGVLERKVEKFTSKVPSWMKTAGRHLYFSHDTPQYKFLSQATQLSDLVARYALYEHTTTRQQDPLSHAAALQLAEDAFVNYDLPSHRTLQYLNDMGIVIFTKYYLRIQKVIMRLVRERPARGLMMAVAEHYFSGLQSVMDSSWLNKIGNNPLQDSAAGFIGALGELPVIKLLK